mgnify:FL=1
MAIPSVQLLRARPLNRPRPGAAVEVILLRVLRNLQRAFHQKGSEHYQSTIEHQLEQMLFTGLV